MTAPVRRPSQAATNEDLNKRIRILEAVPPSAAGSCQPFSSFGGNDLLITHVDGESGCGTPTNAQTRMDGLIWSCSSLDVDEGTSLMEGALRITGRASGDPGFADTSDCGPTDFVNYAYGFLPPFWQESEVFDPIVPFGFGYAKQQSTETIWPAYLDYDNGIWVIRMVGTDTYTRSNLFKNCARPPSTDVDEGYPCTFDTDDIYFAGSFKYFVVIGD